MSYPDPPNHHHHLPSTCRALLAALRSTPTLRASYPHHVLTTPLHPETCQTTDPPSHEDRCRRHSMARSLLVVAAAVNSSSSQWSRNHRPTPQLCHVAERGDLREVRRLVTCEAACVDSRVEGRWTAVGVAAFCGRFKIVEFLASQGAFLEDESLLRLACALGKPNVISTLLCISHRLSPDNAKKTQDSRLLLHVALKCLAYKPSRDVNNCLRPLIDAGYDVNAKDAAGKSPLYLALENAKKTGDYGCAAYMFQSGADSTEPLVHYFLRCNADVQTRFMVAVSAQ